MSREDELPSLVKKRKTPVNFPHFEWRDISIKEELGSGTFGSVYLVNYEKDEQNVIVKKMKGEAAEAKRRFEKEAAILNTVKGHRNVCDNITRQVNNKHHRIFQMCTTTSTHSASGRPFLPSSQMYAEYRSIFNRFFYKNTNR